MENFLPEINERRINHTLEKTISARELHAKLEVGKDFTTWIKDRIERYGFIENEDFMIHRFMKSTLTKSGERSNAIQVVNYYLTLGTAKEIALVENNANGRKIRRAFIEFEKKAKHLLAGLAAEHNRKIRKAEIRLLIEKNYITVSNFAKAHNLNYNRVLECINLKKGHQATVDVMKQEFGLQVEDMRISL